MPRPRRRPSHARCHIAFVGVLALAGPSGCGGDTGRHDAGGHDTRPDDAGDAASSDAGALDDAAPDDTAPVDADTGVDETDGADGGPHDAASDTAEDRTAIRVVTFNTGTGARPDPALADAYGWTRDAADLGDAWYGNGLAWVALIDAMAPWMAEQAPDVVGFQEIFWPGACDAIPADAHAGFVCDGDRQPTVAERLVGAGYTVACHPGRPDKCLAVRDGFAQMDGCASGFCLEGLEGATVDGCGSGSRVARTRLTRADGARLDVVHVHGTSGFTTDDVRCRVAWFDAAFADADEAVPTLVLGDFNTDPVRASATDASAARLAELADAGGFTFATATGLDARPTYGGILNIDHVLVRGGGGACLAGGLDAPLPAPLAVEAFDHRPIVCDLTLR